MQNFILILENYDGEAKRMRVKAIDADDAFAYPCGNNWYVVDVIKSN